MFCIVKGKKREGKVIKVEAEIGYLLVKGEGDSKGEPQNEKWGKKVGKNKRSVSKKDSEILGM